MTAISLEPIGLKDGVWRAHIRGDVEDVARFSITYLGDPVPDAAIVPDISRGLPQLAVPVPAAAVSDGVHTFLVQDNETGQRLASFTLIAGAVLDPDIRVELDILRAEVEVLKRALRSHVRNQAD